MIKYENTDEQLSTGWTAIVLFIAAGICIVIGFWIK